MSTSMRSGAPTISAPIIIWDIESANKEMKDQDSLGEIRTILGDLATGGAIEISLGTPNKREFLLCGENRLCSAKAVANLSLRIH